MFCQYIKQSNMLTDQEMLQIAERYLRRLERGSNIEMMIYPDEIIEMPYGNVYYFNSKESLMTRNPIARIYTT